MEVLLSQSTVIGSLFLLFGLLMLGLGIWGRRESEIIFPVAFETPEERKMRVNLLDNMNRYLAKEDIRDLCFALDIEYEDLPGDESRRAKARELIVASERQSKLKDLIAACEEKRPNVTTWTETWWMNQLRPTVAQPARVIFGLSGVTQILIGIMLILFSSPPPVSLLGARFMAGNWDPRQIDLSAVATNGIPVSSNESLQFMDLEIGVAWDAPQFMVKAEVYDGETVIGYSDPVPLLQGQKLALLQIVDSYQYQDLPNAWEVQPAWEMLKLSLIVERNGLPITTTDTNIRLNPAGDAWFIEPPTAQFTTISYSINGGTPLVLDLRPLKDGNGIDVSPGDTLTIHDAWYHAEKRTQDNTTLEVEAHLNSGAYDWETALQSTPVTLQRGIHSLLSPEILQWVVPEGRDQLTIWLVRDDRAVLDELNIPLESQATAGLIPIEEANNVVGNLPHLSLLGISFELGNYNPRLLDLRANPPTLPVRENSLLELSEIWLMGEQADPELWVWVEIYRDEERTQLVGHTEATKLTAERLLLGDVLIDDGADDEVPHNWRIPAEWSDFYVLIVGQYEGSENNIHFDLERIHFDEANAAWLDDSPDASIVSIAYSVNDNPPKLIDLRAIETAGIVAASGDTLTITDIWYHFTPTHQEQGNVFMEAHLSQSDSYEGETRRATSLEPLQKGIYPLSNTTDLNWTVSEGMNRLYLSLTDENGAIVDRLFVALGPETGAHLVPAQTTVLWPFDQVNYFDFEDEVEMVGISGNPPFTEVSRSQTEAFSGNYSLAVTTISDQTVFMKWDFPFQADVVSLQVYWPQIPGYTVHWAQVCFGDGSFCWSIPTAEGRWNTFTMNLFAPANGIPENQMNDRDFGGLFIQGGISGVDTDRPYTFYVDGIQISPSQ